MAGWPVAYPGSGVPGSWWWGVEVMGGRRRLPEVTHPAWCVPQRCEFVVPPQMDHALRHHKGPVRILGDRRVGGSVAVYLFAPHTGTPLVGLYAAGRWQGSGGAKLRLVDVWRLARHLDELLNRAGFVPPLEGSDGDDV